MIYAGKNKLSISFQWHLGLRGQPKLQFFLQKKSTSLKYSFLQGLLCVVLRQCYNNKQASLP